MPIQIGEIEPFSSDEFEELRWQQPANYSVYNPRMLLLLDQLEEHGFVKVTLMPEQTARSIRSAISNSARTRGIKTETLIGDGYVAVRKVGAYPPKEKKEKKS